jgi:hypothetical protein
MGADRPGVTEGVFQLPIAIAPKHVVQRHRDLRARADRLLEDEPQFGFSSLSITTESPMRTLACISFPSEPGIRLTSTAPNAFL